MRKLGHKVGKLFKNSTGTNGVLNLGPETQQIVIRGRHKFQFRRIGSAFSHVAGGNIKVNQYPPLRGIPDLALNPQHAC